MNETIINNVNSVVGPGDILLHLGDWSFGGKDNIKIARDRIVCGNIITFFGNHHSGMREDKELQKPFLWCGDYLEFRVGKKLICCFHYPISDWNEKNRSSLMLSGHSHQLTNNFENGKHLNVGLEAHDMKPWNLVEILKVMENVPVLANHHEGKTR